MSREKNMTILEAWDIAVEDFKSREAGRVSYEESFSVCDCSVTSLREIEAFDVLQRSGLSLPISTASGY